MSLVRHAKSPFWYMSFMVNGKAVFKSTKTANKALAQKIENEARKQMVEDIHFDRKETVTLKDIINIHLSTRKESKSYAQLLSISIKLLGFKRNNVTKEEIDVYGLDGSMPFHELTSKHLVRLMMARRSEGVTTGTFLHEILFINGLMTTAKQLGFQLPDIDIKAFKKDHKLKQERKPIRYLTADEEQRLLAELDPNKELAGLAAPADRTSDVMRIKQDAYDFAIALLDSGARHEEIASIEWTRIDLEGKTIRLIRGKTNNESTLYMTDRLYEVMLRRSKNKDSEQYVFTNKAGGPRNYSLYGFASACRRAGIENCTFHTMRKTLASKLVRGGLAINDVSVILGHSSVATTQAYYASLSPAESSKRALALLNA
jgi:integrase